MIKSPDLYLQGRTMQATDANNKPVAASVFGAYAIQVPQSINHAMSDCIFLRMVSEESKNFAIGLFGFKYHFMCSKPKLLK